MKSFLGKYKKVWTITVVLLLLFIPLAIRSQQNTEVPINDPAAENASVAEPKEDIPAPIRKTKKHTVEQFEDLNQTQLVDLEDPENLKSGFEYDPQTGTYLFKTKVGDIEVGTPFMLTKEEYLDYTLKESMQAYYRDKVSENIGDGKKPFNIADMRFNLGPAEKIFGPGGVQLKTSGSAELVLGIKTTDVKNPSLPENQRSRTYFDFDEKIQINVSGKVGDKINFGLNYNTEASFDFDQSLIKINYDGKEDEIIKKIEAGNVSMQTSNALIPGSSALFGIKTELQFGKLQVRAVASQQDSESKTINTKGGVQTTPFDLKVDQYDENRHFFLSYFFRDTYDKSMSKLPYISNGVKINRVEAWITNKRSNYNQARNILAFVDLGEPNDSRLYNRNLWSTRGMTSPDNNANTLYQEMNTTYSAARNISQVTSVLQSLEGLGFQGQFSYDKVESARRLDPSEYTINEQLGYISLKSALSPDEVLAVAYEYTLNGRVYQVGEFATDQTTDTESQTSTQCLYLKLLKNTGFTPQSGCWGLMMKNVYSLNTYQVQQEKFKLDIYYQNDTSGVYLNYITEGKIKNQLLLRVMNLDRLNSKKDPYSDGFFDFVEGFTILSQNGKIIFPVVEPFGKHLRDKIGNESIADKYVFQELYDSTLTVARQFAHKNKFRIRGEYKASSGSEIQLGAMNVPRGSVRVMAGGKQLAENTDYTVDYTMGVVNIINTSILESGTSVSVSLENQSTFSLQRKTLLGLDLNYTFSDRFNLGATVMYMGEKPLTQKVTMGSEPIENTIWGLNLSYKSDVSWLTKAVSWLPGVSSTTPSSFSLNADFAHLIPGHPKVIGQNGLAYLDDFESTRTTNDIRYPDQWFLSSTPFETRNPKFPEASKSNDVSYGYNRARLAWYFIDQLFTRKNSTQTPNHIRNDLDQLSNHYVREVLQEEVFPNKQALYGQSNVMQVLNLAYYPQERGPYNLDTDVDYSTGLLNNPQKRWGGMMRKTDNSDFEAANIEYIQFWVMDPFAYDSTTLSKGGDLYFNLGEISEDILKDGKKYFENGLPIDGDPTAVESTVWGLVPKRQSLVYAFDNTPGARKVQDVGLNGLPTEAEQTFSTYADFVQSLRNKVSAEVWAKYQNDPFSPFNDPASDNFHYYRGADFDRDEIPILERYKHYNSPEGNSAEGGTTAYDQSSTTLPDVEDINQDNTLNEYERYYEYKVAIKPEEMRVGNNYIVNKQTSNVKLADGSRSNITWYQFKIPIREYQNKVGSISDFKTIRFIRMYMSGFEKPVVLRFATLELVRGEWRTFQQDLYDINNPPPKDINTMMDVSAVNIEESGAKEPVNYVLPPGVTRVVDPGQPQIRQQNEQALSMKVNHLAPADARAVYKNITFDMRQYKTLQMFVHAEKLIDDKTDLKNSDMYVFIRMGSDYTTHYYEYEIPLELTVAGSYNNDSESDRLLVWPESNFFNFNLELLTNAKTLRNKEKGTNHSISYSKPYSIIDPTNMRNKITIVGNPSLSEVKTIMIGVRNRSNLSKSIEVWVNELRLSGFNEQGGWAVQAKTNVTLSDFATVSFSGRIETAGFGTVEQSVQARRQSDLYQYALSTSVEAGKIFPEKAKVKLPIYFSLAEEFQNPKYNPLDQDVLLSDALNTMERKADKDSLLRLAQDRYKTTSISLANVKVDITSKNPMPWDPANLSLSFNYNKNEKYNPTTEREINQNFRGGLYYSYTPFVKPVEPFKRLKSKSKWAKALTDFNFFYAPNFLSFSTDMDRQYYEMQLRDLTSGTDINMIPLSVSKDFKWNRNFAIRWDLTRSLKLSLTTAHNARIDETLYSAVNKELYPDEYKNWQDTVLNSIKNFGSPMLYQQTFNASYTLPLNRLPITDWITVNGQYNAIYNWERGAMIDEDVELGNKIMSQMNWQIDGRLMFESLYNKSRFLKEANRHFNQPPKPKPKNNLTPKKEPKPYETYVQLKSDTAVLVSHRLRTKKPKIIASRQDGSSYPIKYKIVDENQILITTQDTTRIFLSMLAPPDPKESGGYKLALGLTRVLMFIRNVSATYRDGNSMIIPGFRGEPVLFGQNQDGSLFTPGLDFAFGFAGEDYLEKARRNGWLVSDTTVTSPMVSTRSREFQFRATLEPWPGLKIELNGNWTHNSNKQIQYMFDGMPSTFGGNFTMTTAAIMTAFNPSNAKEGFKNETFERFRSYRQEILNRLDAQLVGTYYPDAGFIPIEKRGQLRQNGDPGYSRNSADVLIPAFLAAYTGQGADKVGLSAFPSLLSILPNWRITFDGLTKIGNVSKYFKNITLSHAYRCTYSVGGYNSFTNFVEAGDDFGYIRDVLSGNALPSSGYDISSVNITESFTPLFGVDVGMKNNITCKGEYKTSRNLSLNISSVQLVETTSDELVVGLGYKMVDFNFFVKNKKTEKSKKVSNDLTLRGDFSYRVQRSLIRKIEDGFTEPTSGNETYSIKISADYVISSMMNIRLFYDWQSSAPLVSSASYPISNSNIGVSLRISLTR